MKQPNVIFCNLQNSGSSAVDPVLRELLSTLSYETTPFGPEATERFVDYLDHQGPVYHWTHNPIQTFQEFGVLERLDYRFVYLHRDYRDVAISLAKDHISRGIFTDVSLNKAIARIVEEHLPALVRITSDWLEFARRRPDLCLEIRFDEIKTDMIATTERILYFLGLHVEKGLLRQVVEKHSFEKITGRKRGEEGETVRTGYMYRKGISGEWRKYFNLYVTERFGRTLNKYLVDYRWEERYDWGPKGAQLVSSPFSSGVSWLVNVLLELNIKTTHLTEAEDHWCSNRGAYEITQEAYELCRWHLPVLGRKREFTFDENIEVVWEHRLDLAVHTNRKTILYVRDPRDAIYSLYRRHYKNKLSLHAYLHRPDVWPDHFPDMFGLPPADTWAYFHLFWFTMKDFIPLKIVHFEEMRDAPVSVVEGMLAYLEISRTNDEIVQALNESTFEKARAQALRVSAQAGQDRQAIRKGEVGEWRSVYSESELAVFEGPAHYVMTLLNYRGDEDADRQSQLVPFSAISSEHPIISASVKRAREEIVSLNGGAVIEILSFALMVSPQNVSQRRFIAAMILAADWTTRIFGEYKELGSIASVVFKRFVEINMFFEDHPPVRTLLEKTASENETKSKAAMQHMLLLIKRALVANDLDEVFRWADMLSKKAPNLPHGFATAGKLLFQTSRYKKAIPYLKRAAELSDSDPSFLAMLNAARENSDVKKE